MIKSYTDIEQSKKLAEILPIESADMYYSKYDTIHANTLYRSCDNQDFNILEYIPCWSLAALLDVLPKEIVYDKHIVYLEFHVWENSLVYVNDADYILCVTKTYDNPIDVCYEMIIKLKELNLL